MSWPASNDGQGPGGTAEQSWLGLLCSVPQFDHQHPDLRVCRSQMIESVMVGAWCLWGQWIQAAPCLPCGVVSIRGLPPPPATLEHPQHILCCSDALLPWRPLTGFLGLRMEETVLGCWEDRVTSWSSPQACTTCQSSALHCTAGRPSRRVVLSGSGPGQALLAVKEN